MMHKEDITEQDIFYYVNFPDSLSPEKREFIRRNENIFKSDIEFCKESIAELPDSITNKISTAFFSDKTVTVIDLFRIEDDLEEPVREFVLAADSGVKESILKVDTFKDEDNQFLLKVVCSGNKRKFYCLKSSGELLTDYYLKIFPSEQVIHLQPDSGWMEFSSDLIIDSIKIKVNS